MSPERRIKIFFKSQSRVRTHKNIYAFSTTTEKFFNDFRYRMNLRTTRTVNYNSVFFLFRVLLRLRANLYISPPKELSRCCLLVALCYFLCCDRRSLLKEAFAAIIIIIILKTMQNYYETGHSKTIMRNVTYKVFFPSH